MGKGAHGRGSRNPLILAVPASAIRLRIDVPAHRTDRGVVQRTWAAV